MGAKEAEVVEAEAPRGTQTELDDDMEFDASVARAETDDDKFTQPLEQKNRRRSSFAEVERRRPTAHDAADAMVAEVHQLRAGAKAKAGAEAKEIVVDTPGCVANVFADQRGSAAQPYVEV